MEEYEQFVAKIPGRRAGSTAYKEIGTEFTYKLTRKKGEKLYLSCTVKWCPGRAVVTPMSLNRRKKHTHGNDLLLFDNENDSVSESNKKKNKALSVKSEALSEVESDLNILM